MRVIRGHHNLHHAAKDGCVATIGNFDGVHKGHQAILSQVKQKSAELGVPSTVIIFEPQPEEYFSVQLNRESSPRIFPLRDKLKALRYYGIEQVLVISFNQAFADLSPTVFIERYLLSGLNIKHLVVGDDFHFGAKRAGDIYTLRQAGNDNGFTVEDTVTVMHQEQRISSTWLRSALTKNNPALAAELLGRKYALSGRVKHGDKRGRTIQFPTINLVFPKRDYAILGVYAVTVVFGGEGDTYHGVANIGYRPTINNQNDSRCHLEVHLFDFDDTVYGDYIDVTFEHFIRTEKSFSGIEALKQAIAADVATAKDFFK